jgi:pilus assembly protein Flp/PilA
MVQLLDSLQMTLHTLGVKVSGAIRRRAGDDSGQTAAEYMGIIVIVTVIIVAIAGTNLGTTIASAISSHITTIIGLG